MLLAFMGIGGAVMVGYTQGAKKDAEHAHYMHNMRVLNEAKQALLQYAYNYPVTSGFGPGRMPCPDTDNDGLPDPSFYCINGNEIVGRFPWFDSDLNFYDARDASGERLWYAVSRNFANTGPLVSINSDTTGTITIHDQTGALVYDGLGSGVVAVIIAPGPAIDRNGVLQDRSVANGDDREDIIADTDPGIVDPVNYLDLFGALDNADFINSDSGNGFVLGPVDDLAAEELIVNDQMVVITAEEVIAMAEKATLQAYRGAIDEYQANIGVNRYPWLDPYSSPDGLGTFDAVITAATPVSGRLPSIFANYFDSTNPLDSQRIKPELRLSINIDGEIYNLNIPAPGVENTYFKANGDLVSPLNNNDSITRFFWDGYKNGPADPNSPADGIWEVCPLIGARANEDDCNRTAAGTFEGAAGSPGDSDVWLEVRDVTITFSGGTPIEFAFTDRTPTPVEYWVSSIENPDLQNHAYVAAEYDESPAYISNFTWAEDEEFRSGFSIEPPGNVGAHIYDAPDTIKVGLPYYPVLPAWALTDGWHDTLMMVYSAEYQPDGDGACTPEDGDTATGQPDDCIVIANLAGVSNDIVSLLVLAGESDLLDGDDLNGDLDYLDLNEVAPDNDFSNDLYDVFEPENYSGIGPDPVPNNDPDPPSDTGLGLVFDNRETVVTGNDADVLFIVEQL